MGQEILEGSIIKLAPGKSLICLDNGSLQLDPSTFNNFLILIKQFNGTKEPLDLPSWPQGGYVNIPADFISAQNQDGVYDGNLYITLDDEITDILAQHQRLGFIITIKNCNCSWRVQVEGDELQASWASRKAKENKAFADEKHEEIRTAVNINEAKAEPQKISDSSNLKRILLIAGGILFAALIFFIIYFLFFRNGAASLPETQNMPAQSSAAASSDHEEDADSADPASQVSGSVNEALQSSPCSLSESNDALLLKNCFKSSPTPDALENLAYDALAAKRCDLAKRLLSNLARNGNAKLALQFAKYADPNVQEENTCISKDAEIAKYWYQKVLEQGDNAEALSAMEKLK